MLKLLLLAAALGQAPVGGSGTGAPVEGSAVSSTGVLSTSLDANGNLVYDSTQVLTLGTSAITSRGLLSGNVLVGGALEVDGISYFEGAARFYVSAQLFDNIGLYLGNGSDNWFVFNTSTAPDQLELRSTDCDGGGTDCAVLTNAAGTDDIHFAGTHTYHGEMGVTGNATTITPVANEEVAVTVLTGGEDNAVSFVANSSGAITAYADGTGKVNVTDATHGLVTGDMIRISDSTNYNGFWMITYIDDDTFSIPDTWVADDGASTWTSGDTLVIANAGTYIAHMSFSAQKGAGATTNAMIYFYCQGVKLSSHGLIIERTITGTEFGSLGASGIFTAAAGDRCNLGYESDTANTILFKHGNVSIHQL